MNWSQTRFLAPVEGHRITAILQKRCFQDTATYLPGVIKLAVLILAFILSMTTQTADSEGNIN